MSFTLVSVLLGAQSQTKASSLMISDVDPIAILFPPVHADIIREFPEPLPLPFRLGSSPQLRNGD